MSFEIERQLSRPQGLFVGLLCGIWPSITLVALLSVLSSQPVIYSRPNWGTGGSLFHVRATELVLLGAAVLASLGSKRIREMGRSFLCASLSVLAVLQAIYFLSDFQFDTHSLPTDIIKWLAQIISFCCNAINLYFLGIAPDPDLSDIDYYSGAMGFITSWWIGALVACAVDLNSSLRQRVVTVDTRPAKRSRWNLSLKEFLLFVSLAAWTLGVLQMPLWRQRYAAIAMLVIGALAAAFGCGVTSKSVRSAGRAWLLVAGVYLGFLMVVRGDAPPTPYVDSAVSTAVMEIAMVPLLDVEKSWNWWLDFDGDHIYELYDARARGYIITWTCLLCFWLATGVAILCYRRESHELEHSATHSPWRSLLSSVAIRHRLSPAIAGLLLLGGLTAIAGMLKAEHAAHFAMKLTEAAFLGWLLVAFAFQGRLRRFATRFLTVAVAFLFIQQFANFYRLENAWGDSPFLRLYSWLWNWRHGEPYPPYEHERHLLLRSLTYLHVDYLVACDCITSWWLGGIAACGLDFVDNRNEASELVTNTAALPFWTLWRRMSLLLVTLSAIAVGIWLCNHPARRYYGMSILEVSTILAALGVGIPYASWSARSKRWLLALAVYLGLVIVAYAHDRKWSYWDFGLSTSAFDLLYLHLFHGEPLAFWKIAPPADSQLIDPAAKDFSMALIGIFGVWFASVAAICWRPAQKNSLE